jgi:hypothetical protein
MSGTLASIGSIPVIPSSLIPIADNEDDINLRTGVIGVSLDYGRADHNHPIKRQVIPTTPTIISFGSLVITSQSLVRGWSDEESVTFHIAVNTTQASSGGNWGGLQMPNIAGFQVVKWHGIGSYLQTPPYIMENLGITNWYGTGYVAKYQRTTASTITYQIELKYIRL